jgi:hypothetical protein
VGRPTEVRCPLERAIKKFYKNSHKEEKLSTTLRAAMVHPSKFPDDSAPSSDERLRAFGVIFGEAFVEWRGCGRPSPATSEPSIRSKAFRSENVEIIDIRRRIATTLCEHGPQGPGAIGIHIRRSHRVVYEALKSLAEQGVVTATGCTRGRRFALVENWEAALSHSMKRTVPSLDPHSIMKKNGNLPTD